MSHEEACFYQLQLMIIKKETQAKTIRNSAQAYKSLLNAINYLINFKHCKMELRLFAL
jgi:hypothetical protein